MVWDDPTNPYDRTMTQLTTRAEIRSVMVPEGNWQVEVCAKPNFEDCITMEHDVAASNPDDRNDCLDITDVNVAGRVHSIRFSEL